MSKSKLGYLICRWTYKFFQVSIFVFSFLFFHDSPHIYWDSLAYSPCAGRSHVSDKPRHFYKQSDCCQLHLGGGYKRGLGMSAEFGWQKPKPRYKSHPLADTRGGWRSPTSSDTSATAMRHQISLWKIVPTSVGIFNEVTLIVVTLGDLWGFPPPC